MSNAGGESGVVVDRAKQSTDYTGYDARNERWGNMPESGILDPGKVTQSALENARQSLDYF